MSGTFVPGVPDDVSGGGTWILRKSKGDITDSGTYWVTGLISWHLPPGTPDPAGDGIGNPLDRRPGFSVLRVAYSNGSRGILVVSCTLVGTPGTVFEGITATMDFIDFWNNEPPQTGVDANRTVFHVSPISASRASADTSGGEAVNAASSSHKKQSEKALTRGRALK